MAYASTSERSGWEKRKSDMPAGMGEEIMRLAFQSTSRKEWADWLRAPLLGAVAQGSLPSVLALLKAGANSVLEDEGVYPTMMHAAAEGGNAEIARALLDHSAEHDLAAGFHHSPLHVAAGRGHAAVARVLMRAGARVHDDWPVTPLHLACANGHHEVAADLLMNGANVNALTFAYQTPLCLAASRGHVETTKVLMRAAADPEYKANEGVRPAVAAAAASGHVPVIRQLVADGAKVNPPSWRWTTLHIYMENGTDLAVVRALIDSGNDVNASAPPTKITPLHMAAKNDNALGMKALAEAGADVEARTTRSETPLHIACRFASWHAVNALLQLGAETAATDRSNRTPRDVVPPGRPRTDEIFGLLDRAPAIRAWHHRGWIVMLRARRVGARLRGGEETLPPPASQGETTAAEVVREGQRDYRDEADGPRRKSGRRGKEGGPAVAVAAEKASSGFAGAMSLLLGVEDDALFRSIVLFL